MERRDWLLGTVLVGAAVAGGRWWLRQGDDRLADAGPGETGSEGVAALWPLRLPQADGGELVFESLRGRPLVINFWATWCPPCVKEMPLLDRFAREHPQLAVVGVAVDKMDAVRSFLARTPVAFRIGVAGFAGSALARQLGNAQGGLPYSVAVDRRGQILAQQLGETHSVELEAWARRLQG